MNPIFRSNGIYIGFISSDGILFSRDGEYLGWVEDDFVWDSKGKFRGQLWNNRYIILNKFAVSPIPRTPRLAPLNPIIPPPPVNIPAVALPTGWSDAF
ncbi:MAG: 4-fold beta flower protein [Patescibacteria group bacterium]